MKPLILIVMDGWGIARPGRGNAITRAKPKFFNQLWGKYPHCKLKAHGKYVGLLPGYIGNSQVGHLTIGAGRLVKQDLTRISDAIKNRSFYKNKVLKNAMKTKTLHLIGLLSDAGVHSHIDHLLALVKMTKKVEQVYIHCILDGRDTPPKSAAKYLRILERKLPKNCKISTIMGRYYAMDRDNRWNRTKKAHSAITKCSGYAYNNWKAALEAAYKRGESDEFVKPTIIAHSKIGKKDSIIFFNFRNDRAKQLTQLFTKTKKRFVAFTEYYKNIKAEVAFPPVKLKNTLGEVLANNKLKQFRLAETEKWAHATFFFNGLTDKKFRQEKRMLIASPKVATYDKKPEMSANKIKKKAIDTIKNKKYPFIFVNFANADMVGHTGMISKTIKAVKTVDKCLQEIVEAAKDYNIIITSDHGNAEKMLYSDGSICTAHTTNKVPCIIIGSKIKRNGSLYDIAPTVLKLMGIKKPKEMTGKSLV